MKRTRPSKDRLEAVKAAAQAKRAELGLEPVPDTCPTCGGAGKVGVWRKVGSGMEEQWVRSGDTDCHVCGGSGKR